ncbi:unnamed protein product [Alopecurus aequalis]
MATFLLLATLLLVAIPEALAKVSNTTVVVTSRSGCPSESYRCGNTVEIRYPFWVGDDDTDGHGAASHCGYPTLRLECRRETPVLRLPSGEFGVTRILYAANRTGDRTLSLFDLGVGSGKCPHQLPVRNFTLPSGSPPPLSLTARDDNFTFLLNCSFVGVADEHIVPCLNDSYVFRAGGVPFDAGSLCQHVVVTPVLKPNPLDDVFTALRAGFELSWRPAVGGVCGLNVHMMQFPFFLWLLEISRRTVSSLATGMKTSSKSIPGHRTYPFSTRLNKEGNVLKIVLPITGSFLILACIIIFWMYKSRGERQINDVKNKEHGSGNIEFPSISFEDIIAATNNFSNGNILGKGGFGTVYKGLLPDGKEVAVKRLSKMSRQGGDEFKNELVLIAKLQHKNLVRLLGYCIHDAEKLILYEYLPNKSLDAFLFDASRRSFFDWPTRLRVIKGVARGVLYLHQDSRLTVIHRDLKLSNILLDAEMNPKISDFGMARIFGGNEQQAKTIRVVGTPGYMSPEYALEGVFSNKSDTYSFGILVLEIVTGLKIRSPQHLIMDFQSLTAYAWRLWKDGNMRALVDSSIVDNCALDEVVRCIQVGLLCVQDQPDVRPSMSSVVFMLENETTPLPTPKQPIYYSKRSHEDGGQENVGTSFNDVTITVLEGR